jgi:hypothetical protein
MDPNKAMLSSSRGASQALGNQAGPGVSNFSDTRYKDELIVSQRPHG